MTDFSKIPPHDIDMEQSVIGAIFLNSKCLTKITKYLPNEFYYYKDAHQIIYKVILELFKEKVSIDILTVAERLFQKKVLDKIGGSVYLSSMEEMVVSTVNIGDHAKIVLEKALLREIIVTTSEAMNFAYNEEYTAKEIIMIHNKKNSDLLSSLVKNDNIFTLSDACDVCEKELEKDINSDEDEYYDIGIIKLNRNNFEDDEFIVWAGRPGSGKTSKMLAKTVYLAKKYPKKNFYFFSDEMGKKKILKKVFCCSAEKGWIEIDTMIEFDELVDVVQSKNNNNLFIITGMTKIEDKLTFLNSEQIRLEGTDIEIGGVDIDYAQIQESYQKFNSPKERLAFVCREIRKAKTELNCMFHVGSQVTRESTKRNPPIPHYDDAGQADEIGNDCDKFIGLWCPNLKMETYQDVEYSKNDNIYLLVMSISKNRNHSSHDCEIGFYRKRGTFCNDYIRD